VDVRSPGEFKDGAYPGAVNIPSRCAAEARGARAQDAAHCPVLRFGSAQRPGHARIEAGGFTDVVNAGGLDDMPE